MKTEVTKTVVTVEEKRTCEIGKQSKATAKEVIFSVTERTVSMDGRVVYAETIPTDSLEKFALPELQTFMQACQRFEKPCYKMIYLSTGFYKTLCIVLACIWLVTLLFFLYRPNLSV